MRSLRTTIIVASVTILAFDAVGSVAARLIGFDYSRLSPGSYAIYFVAGIVAGWQGSVLHGAIVGAVTGAIEAAAGWPLSALLGPPGIAEIYSVTPIGVKAGMVLRLGVGGSVLGFVGGLVGEWFRGRRAAA